MIPRRRVQETDAASRCDEEALQGGRLSVHISSVAPTQRPGTADRRELIDDAR